MIIPSNCGDLKDILFQLGEQKGSLRGLLNFWSRRPRGATKKVRALPATWQGACNVTLYIYIYMYIYIYIFTCKVGPTIG